MIAKPSLPISAYVSSSQYQQEQALIFSKQWLFVGFTSQLASHNDYITTEIANTPVVVQNFDGTIQALLNICSHRKATLQIEKSGNRPLSCPYHCWKYGKNGLLNSIPKNNSDFKLDKKDRQNLSLKQFPLAQCGHFIFVRLASEGPSLKDFLGEYFDILQYLSEYFTSNIQKGQFSWKANWKLAVETVLEVYHVPATHPDTFAKLATTESHDSAHLKHNSSQIPLKQATKDWWQGVRNKLQLKQCPDYQEYRHFFIYPNLAIAITNGSLMSVQTYEPINKSQTKLSYSLHVTSTTKSHNSTVSNANKAKWLQSAVVSNLTQFNHETLEEDRLMAESCQQNFNVTGISPGLLGAGEIRISYFHEALSKDLIL